MFSIVSFLALILGVMAHDSALEIASGLFAIAGAIEYGVSKYFEK